MKDEKKYSIDTGPVLVPYQDGESHIPIREKKRLVPLKIYDTKTGVEVFSIRGDGHIVSKGQSIFSPDTADALIAWMGLDVNQTRVCARIFGLIIGIEYPDKEELKNGSR